MTRYLVRRRAGAVLVLIALSMLVFVIFVVVPGGAPAVRIAGKNATDSSIASIRHDWGYDRPLPVQYLVLMKKMATGDLVSYTSQQNVVDQIVAGAPATFSLTIGAAVIWLLSGIAVGTIAALRAGRLPDVLLTALALVGISMPVFWLGVVARYLLAERHSIVPDGEYVGFFTNPWQWFTHLLVPWLVLAVGYVGFYGRVLRGSILDTIGDDHIRTAKAKGLTSRRVLSRHVLRNAILPLVLLIGLDFAAVIGGGAILTESVFDLHGVGQYAAQSIAHFDLPPIMGVTLYGAAFIVVFSVAIDLVHAYL